MTRNAIFIALAFGLALGGTAGFRSTTIEGERRRVRLEARADSLRADSLAALPPDSAELAAAAAAADSAARAAHEAELVRLDSLRTDSIAHAQEQAAEHARLERERAQVAAQRLAKIFAAMRPPQAAAVVGQLSEQEARAVLVQMSAREAAAIIASLDPARAAGLTRIVLGNEESEE